MIRAIASYIEDKLIGGGFLETFYGLVEQKTDGTQVWPAYYDGEYKSVSNFDSYNGLAYLRIDGKPSMSPFVDDTAACANVLQVLYPIKLVFCIPREKVKTDDAFAKETLVMDIIKAVTTSHGALKVSLKAKTATLIPSGWDTDSIRVMGEEYTEIPIADINHEFIYGSISLTADIVIKKDCIETSCEEVCYG